MCVRETDYFLLFLFCSRQCHLCYPTSSIKIFIQLNFVTFFIDHFICICSCSGLSIVRIKSAKPAACIKNPSGWNLTIILSRYVQTNSKNRKNHLFALVYGKVYEVNCQAVTGQIPSEIFRCLHCKKIHLQHCKISHDCEILLCKRRKAAQQKCYWYKMHSYFIRLKRLILKFGFTSFYSD